MIITALYIDNFRCFKQFTLQALGRINLLVGTNNSGKSSILEALRISMAAGDVTPLWSIMMGRGEEIWVDRDSSSVSIGSNTRQVEIRHLFHGHNIENGSNFHISTDAGSRVYSLIAEIDEYRAEASLFDSELQNLESPEDFIQPLSLSLRWSNGPGKDSFYPFRPIPITRRGGISAEAVRRSSTRSSPEEAIPIRFVNASSLTADAVIALYDDISLTPEEELVIEAMRIIDPSIERIATAGSERGRLTSRLGSRGGIYVRRKGNRDRVPIGSMGDGIWRMLGLALSVVSARNGILLVDEIDTGLHHSVMQRMWQFLCNCSKIYNIQIFATTHSQDCYQSLAVICSEDISDTSEVTIQRIERNKIQAVAYTEQEIIAAAERDIEVR